MMAPYAIAHMKIGLKLGETGYRFQSRERARVYLTNSLEPVSDLAAATAANLFEALGHEAQAVNRVKGDQRFTVVIGNPPYSIQSQNLTEPARGWVDKYRFVDGVRITERNALQFEKNIQDDYVKFIRFSEFAIESSGSGIVGLVTNHGFLDGATFRGMRWHLLNSFGTLRILDLHGNSNKGETAPEGTSDENVFDISQGVAISFLAKGSWLQNTGQVLLSDLWGPRSGAMNAKYEWLNAHSPSDTIWDMAVPAPPLYLFKRLGGSLHHEYGSFASLTDVMPLYSMGIKTSRDNLVIDFEPNPILERIERFRSDRGPDEAVCAKLGVSLKKGWNISKE